MNYTLCGCAAGSHFFSTASCRAEPSRAGPGRAGPSRAEPCRAGPGRAEPSRAEPSRSGADRAGPGRADLGRGRIEPSRAEPMLICCRRQAPQSIRKPVPPKPEIIKNAANMQKLLPNVFEHPDPHYFFFTASVFFSTQNEPTINRTLPYIFRSILAQVCHPID